MQNCQDSVHGTRNWDSSVNSELVFAYLNKTLVKMGWGEAGVALGERFYPPNCAPPLCNDLY